MGLSAAGHAGRRAREARSILAERGEVTAVACVAALFEAEFDATIEPRDGFSFDASCARFGVVSVQVLPPGAMPRVIVVPSLAPRYDALAAVAFGGDWGVVGAVVVPRDAVVARWREVDAGTPSLAWEAFAAARDAVDVTEDLALVLSGIIVR